MIGGLLMDTLHTRSAPNGSQAEITLIDREASSLRYGETVQILVNGNERVAVVDVILAAFWGGPTAALDYWLTHQLPHPRAMIKLVWKYDDESWDESRDVCEVSAENYAAWIKAFDGYTPPTPIPVLDTGESQNS
jgi:hypothetical protein